jgi:hypothetical protein
VVVVVVAAVAMALVVVICVIVKVKSGILVGVSRSVVLTSFPQIHLST